MSEAPMIQAKIDTSKLQPAIVAYANATGKSMQEVIAKKTNSLSIAIYQSLRKARTSAVGIKAIWASRLAEGFAPSVRDSILAKWTGRKVTAKSKSGRRLNWYQMAVKSEISARASAGGFLAYSTHFSGKHQSGFNPDGSKKLINTVFSRYSQMLSVMALGGDASNPGGTISWPGLTKTGAKAVEGLETPRQWAATQEAIDAETRDIVQYVSNLLQSKYNTMAQA